MEAVQSFPRQNLWVNGKWRTAPFLRLVPFVEQTLVHRHPLSQSPTSTRPVLRDGTPYLASNTATRFVCLRGCWSRSSIFSVAWKKSHDTLCGFWSDVTQVRVSSESVGYKLEEESSCWKVSGRQKSSITSIMHQDVQPHLLFFDVFWPRKYNLVKNYISRSCNCIRLFKDMIRLLGCNSPHFLF